MDEAHGYIVSETVQPPIGGMGGSVWSWERGLDPWHEDAFPTELRHVGTTGRRRAGWFALDHWGNPIGFVTDGTDLRKVFPVTAAVIELHPYQKKVLKRSAK